MKLFYHPGACSLATRIIIHETNLPSEFCYVDLKTKLTAENVNFLDINPKGKVPTLVLSDAKHSLTENIAILQYLGDNSKAIEVLPPESSFQRYVVIAWLSYISTEIHSLFSYLFNPSIKESDKKQFFIPRIEEKMLFLNNQLSKQVYIAGESFSVADAYFCVMMLWAHRLKLNLKSLSHLARYYKQLLQRPAIKKSFEEESIPLVPF